MCSNEDTNTNKQANKLTNECKNEQNNNFDVDVDNVVPKNWTVKRLNIIAHAGNRNVADNDTENGQHYPDDNSTMICIGMIVNQKQEKQQYNKLQSLVWAEKKQLQQKSDKETKSITIILSNKTQP